MKATPNTLASDTNVVCPTSVSDADDVTMMSSSQNEGAHVNYIIPTNKDPPEVKTTAVIAIMRDKPKNGYHRHRSNKHYKGILVRALLDSGSDGDLVFVSKDKLMMLPYSQKAGSRVVEYFNGIFQTMCKARVELNFFDYSDSKRYYSQPDVVEYKKGSKPQYDLILGTKTMKEFSIMLDFEANTIIIDQLILPMRNITSCKALAQSAH